MGPISVLASFQANVRIQGTGAMRIRLTGPSGTQNFDSATGLIPIDGSWHGYQVVAYCDDSTQSVLVYLDNVLILDTDSISTSGIVAGKYRRVSRVDVNIGTTTAAVDNVQVEPGVNVVSWPACLGLPYTTCTPPTFDEPTNSGGWHAWMTLRFRQPDS